MVVVGLGPIMADTDGHCKIKRNRINNLENMTEGLQCVGANANVETCEFYKLILHFHKDIYTFSRY